MKFTENELEQAAIEWFEGLGYTHIFGPDIAPNGEYKERNSNASG